MLHFVRSRRALREHRGAIAQFEQTQNFRRLPLRTPWQHNVAVVRFVVVARRRFVFEQLTVPAQTRITLPKKTKKNKKKTFNKQSSITNVIIVELDSSGAADASDEQRKRIAAARWRGELVERFEFQREQATQACDLARRNAARVELFGGNAHEFDVDRVTRHAGHADCEAALGVLIQTRLVSQLRVCARALVGANNSSSETNCRPNDETGRRR